MPRRISAQLRAQRIHDRGITDEQLAAATGRSKTYIQKVRTGKKPGESLAPALARIDKITRERKTPTAKPLPNVAAEAPRRQQDLRGKEKITDLFEQRVYIGTSRKSGKFHAWYTLYQRLIRAAGRGERVRITTNWRAGQWMGKRGGKTHKGQQYTLWDDGISAEGAIEELDRAGFWDDPARALAALVEEYTTTSDTWLRVDDFDSYSMQIYTAQGGWDVDDEREWA